MTWFDRWMYRGRHRRSDQWSFSRPWWDYPIIDNVIVTTVLTDEIPEPFFTCTQPPEGDLPGRYDLHLFIKEGERD